MLSQLLTQWHLHQCTNNIFLSFFWSEALPVSVSRILVCGRENSQCLGKLIYKQRSRHCGLEFQSTRLTDYSYTISCSTVGLPEPEVSAIHGLHHFRIQNFHCLYMQVCNHRKTLSLKPVGIRISFRIGIFSRLLTQFMGLFGWNKVGHSGMQQGWMQTIMGLVWLNGRQGLCLYDVWNYTPLIVFQLSF